MASIIDRAFDAMGLSHGHDRDALRALRAAAPCLSPAPQRSRPTVLVGLLDSQRASGELPGHPGHERRRQLEERLWAGSRWQEDGYVFTTTIGTPHDGTNVTKRFQGLLARAGIPSRRFHDLRHGAATPLLAQGVHARVVMETLGHSTIAVTMNTYSHVVPALQREAAARLDEALGG